MEPVFAEELGAAATPPSPCMATLRDVVREFAERYHLGESVSLTACELLETEICMRSVNKNSLHTAFTRRNLSVCAYVIHVALLKEGLTTFTLDQIFNLLRPWRSFRFLPIPILESELFQLKSTSDRHLPSFFAWILLQKTHAAHHFRASAKRRSVLKSLMSLCDQICEDSNISPLALTASTLQRCFPNRLQRDAIRMTSGLSQSTLYRAKKPIDPMCKAKMASLQKSIRLSITRSRKRQKRPPD